jgi:hypothetical protein
MEMRRLDAVAAEVIQNLVAGRSQETSFFFSQVRFAFEAIRCTLSSHRLAHANSTARMARPSGMTTMAGPGKTIIANPAARTIPPVAPTKNRLITCLFIDSGSLRLLPIPPCTIELRFCPRMSGDDTRGKSRMQKSWLSEQSTNCTNWARRSALLRGDYRVSVWFKRISVWPVPNTSTMSAVVRQFAMQLSNASTTPV